MFVTVLGCGSSLGVPALKYGWGNCDPGNPKNRRTRSSIKIDTDSFSVLVDTSPDLLWQLQKCKNQKIDAVVFTHFHYDHINGINELRPLFLGSGKKLPVYGTQETLSQIKRKFCYLFKETDIAIYESYFELHEIESELNIGKLNIKCFKQNHGYTESLGIRIGNFAYSTDIHILSDENIQALKGIDTWMVGCLSTDRPTQTHANLPTVLEWIKSVKPRRTFLTHMDSSMDYGKLKKILPCDVAPAYDQMIIKIN